MNIRRGLSRIYVLLSGFVLAIIVIGAFNTMPTASQVHWEYEVFIMDKIAEAQGVSRHSIDWPKDTAENNVRLYCNISTYKEHFDHLCGLHQKALSDLWKKIAWHFAQMFAAFLGAIMGLYAVKKAAGWVADGFSSK